MTEGPGIARIGALIGDPARAIMLTTLMDGQALTASELAQCANISPPTASAHLGKLCDAGLLAVHPQGRHRYFKLANADVAGVLESLMVVAGQPAKVPVYGPRDRSMRIARTCYDHFAGKLGVGLTDVFLRRRFLREKGLDFELTPTGRTFAAEFGIEVGALQRSRRHFARTCLDWSERRPHLSGALGAAVAARCFAKGWVKRVSGSRSLTVTSIGNRELQRQFDLRLN